MMMSLHELADSVQGVLIGDGSGKVSSLSSIEDIKPGSLVFAEGRANILKAEKSEAAVILVNQDVISKEKPVIQVKHPFEAFIQLLTLFYPQPKAVPGIHPTAILEEGVSVGEDAVIGAYVHIGANTVIGARCIIHTHVSIGSNVNLGEDTVLHPHITVYPHSIIGSRVTVHAGSVIGSDGFGYIFVDGVHVKVPHVGCVVIHDDVEIGVNTAIDRATIGETVIGRGTKIDNLVQVAHSVKLGQHNILCAFTGVAGSTTSGDRVIFAANVGVSEKVRIDNDVILTARAGVPPKKHLKEGVVYLGNPARPIDKALEQELAMARLPFMRKKLNALSEKVSALYEQIDLNLKNQDDK